MAEVLSDVITTVVLLVSIEDDTRPLELPWDGAADVAAAEALYAAWRTDYLAVADGAIKGHYHRVDYAEAAFALPTSTAAETGEHAIIITSISALKKATINLPFPKDTPGVVYEGASGKARKKVLSTSSALLAYLDNFEAGGAFVSDGEHILGNIIDGRRAK